MSDRGSGVRPTVVTAVSEAATTTCGGGGGLSSVSSVGGATRVPVLGLSRPRWIQHTIIVRPSGHGQRLGIGVLTISIST
jgi:hypothetical protein